MQVIANPQAEARSTLVSPDALVEGQITIGELITQRIQFQEEKRQANIGAVVRQASLRLEKKWTITKSITIGQPDSLARYKTYLLEICNRSGQRCWLVRLNNPEARLLRRLMFSGILTRELLTS